ncbi:biotin carboxylase N-terminal domain-containing protein [Sulfuritalea sp.]|uniref:acetyl/propionyl/methylcrotonyl-CoA carboxylase subunit alpha n=1 Tax=Sulfuritalea sp. TaxID=2480090 RepID=UPI00286D8C57|nr:biotin carboxylase N-terminal domain-containing protein [Sulfuritalea sp.]
MSFSKILVANRGEIACRIMRTARTLGYRTVAVYSDADAGAPHAAMADEAVRIGPASAAESYLNIAALLAAARKTGADAVHPGYGFLSENAGFARACIEAGLVFIGPPAAAIAAMGDKAGAKRRMAAAGVPTVPGYLGEDQSDATLATEAQKLGYPLLVKAVAGGGGRGMRLAQNAAELPEALAGARREALAAFGDATLMLERLIPQGRHIEIQIFADAHGNSVHLGERDCTTQRRRQKVIEEAPSPIVTPAMRTTMGRDAVAAALAVGYRGAGTVEFIVDRELRHYFLEMNTRLQVEHPVTEMITGLDLVEWQLRVAAGEPLPLKQDEIVWRGHAIEVRLYAEDPYAGFVPQTGPVLHFRPEAALRTGIRIDAGIAEGGAVSPYYDPLLAKVIAHGRDRSDAIRRLMAALEDAPLLGLPTNGRLLRDLVDHESFRAAQMHTTLLDEWATDGEDILQRPQPSEADWQLAAALFAGQPGWRAASVAGFGLTLACGGETRTLRIESTDDTGRSELARETSAHRQQAGSYYNRANRSPVRVGAGSPCVPGTPLRGQVTAIEWRIDDNGRLRYTMDGITRHAIVHHDGDTLHLAREAAVFVFREASPFPATKTRHDPLTARAAVAGTIARLEVGAGDTVSVGQTLAVIEAMKMEMRVTANAAGTVAAIRVLLGQQVEAGAILVELSIEELPCLPTTKPSSPAP